MYNLNNQTEGKQFFKAQVGVLMQEYQRNKQEELVQKQKLKQNIMLQIMGNRNKKHVEVPTQSKGSTSNHSNSNIQVLEENPSKRNAFTFNSNQQLIKTQNKSALNSLQKSKVQNKQIEEQKKIEFEAMTFNEKKINKTIEDQNNYRKRNQLSDHQEQELQKSFDKSKDRITKLANKYFPSHQSKEFEDQNIKRQEYEEQEEQTLSKDYFNQKNPSFLKQDMSDIHSSHLKKVQLSQQYEPQEGEAEQPEPVEQNIQEDDNRGVFLTMQESESMTAEELHKNYAFEIKMDKDVDSNHLEELRKQKIKQMQKKRQQRIEEYRKQESQKKVEQPKPRNSLTSSKHQRNQKQTIQQFDNPPPPKSSNIQRKSNMNRPPKMENKSEKEHAKNYLIPLEQYDNEIKPNKVYKNSYLVKHEQQIKQNGLKQPVYYEQQPYKPVSPMKTPKTIVSENRSKSGHRSSNIFQGQSQYNRQRSANRIPEPKIEPKQRKNSFNRQSNKKIMINAITHVCLPGQLNRKQRQKFVQILQSSEHQFFIFLFKEYSRKVIKGIYVLDNTQTRLLKIFGDKSPYQITPDRVQQFYRYDSGSKEFKKVDGCKSFSLTINAIDLK